MGGLRLWPTGTSTAVAKSAEVKRESSFCFFVISKDIYMALQKHRHQQGFWHKAAKTVETGIKVAGTAKALYDAGRIAYTVARSAAPMVSALL